MSDEQNFPTAIVPTRSGSQHERFDTLARRLGDPMARLFLIAASSPSEEMQFRASAELMPYRYPKLRVQETRLSADTGAGGGMSITINIGGPPADPALRAVDVTPKPHLPPDPLD